MNISEIFHSIQGEGKLTGVPSVFVRTSGCNLRCTWCDTPYTSWSPEGAEQSIDEIMLQVTAHPTRYVVLTGGEPMIAPDVSELCRIIRAAGLHLTIETAATVWRDIECDLASISPKLANSTPHTREGGRYAAGHERQRINLDTIRRFMAMPDYQLKFVIAVPEDLGEVDELLAELGECQRENVLLMPEGVTREELAARGPWVAEMCKRRGFRYCPRLHIDLFGNTLGT